MFGFDYRFLTEDGKVELGQVSKSIGGLGGLQEMFFSADNYFLEVNPELADQPMAKMLISGRDAGGGHHLQVGIAARSTWRCLGE